MNGEWLTLWTVRVAVALYAIALARRLSDGKNPSSLRQGRLLWTAGYLLFLVHVVCAFHFYHDWSHRVAWEATARQTRQFTGLEWGGGLYANYAFVLVWGADVLWWWRFPSDYLTRHIVIESIVQGFLAFITFNATVVFASEGTRWLGLAAFLLLAGSSIRRFIFTRRLSRVFPSR